MPTGDRWFKAKGERLAAGGWLTPWQTGHWDVTGETAERFGFSSAAIAILRDAAQDPDFYEWTHPAAHAQTPDGVDLLPEGDPQRAKAVEGELRSASARLDAAVPDAGRWFHPSGRPENPGGGGSILSLPTISFLKVSHIGAKPRAVPIKGHT